MQLEDSRRLGTQLSREKEELSQYQREQEREREAQRKEASEMEDQKRALERALDKINKEVKVTAACSHPYAWRCVSLRMLCGTNPLTQKTST